MRRTDDVIGCVHAVVLKITQLIHGHFSLSTVTTGNCNLVYAIIRKRNVFHQLANLPSDPASIQKALQKKKKSPDVISRTSSQETVSMEGSHPAVPAEPGTLKASLVAMPGSCVRWYSYRLYLKWNLMNIQIDLKTLVAIGCSSQTQCFVSLSNAWWIVEPEVISFSFNYDIVDISGIYYNLMRSIYFQSNMHW